MPLDGPLHKLKTLQVAAFIGSLQAGGQRDSCPAGCTLPGLFNASLFAAKDVDGAGLMHLVHSHDAGLPKEAIHNDTLRAAHVLRLKSLADGLLEPSLKPDVIMAFFNRLRDAVRHVTTAATTSGDAAGASPPAVPANAQGRRRSRMLARRGRRI